MKLLSIAVSVFLLQTPATQPPKASIEGTVVQASSGVPLAGAKVILARVATQGVGTPAPLPALAPPPPPPPPPAPGVGLTGAGGAAPTGNFSIITTSSGGGGLPPNTPGVPPLPTATTDSNGKYTLKDLDPGTYRVTVAANGYSKLDYGQRTVTGSGTPITLAAGQAAKDINVTLTPAGNLSGHIRDSFGMPAAGVPIQLLRATYNANGLKSFQSVESSRTDDRGEYRLFWLTPGRYYLNAGSPPGPSNGIPFRSGVVSPNQVPGESFLYSYYPGVTNVSQAVAIDVGAGAEMSGVDFNVNRQQLLSVRGRVVDSRTGQAPPSVGISLSYQVFDGGGTFGAGSNYNATTGTFELSNVNPGQYTIVATVTDTTAPPDRTGVPSRSVSSATLPVDITGADLENVVLALLPSSPLSGQVSILGTTNTQPSAVRIQLRPSANGVLTSTIGFNAPQVPAPGTDGSFRVEAMSPGEYRIAANLPQDFYLKEATYNQNDVLNKPFVFSANDNGKLEVVVSPGAGQITGLSLDEKSLPASGISMVLIPDQHRDRNELFKNTTTDSNGKYTIRGIPPGDYKLYAWDSMEQFAWFDPDVMAKYESQGRPIHVTELSNQTFDMKIIH